MAEHEPNRGASDEWFTPPEIFAALAHYEGGRSIWHTAANLKGYLPGFCCLFGLIGEIFASVFAAFRGRFAT